MNAEFAVWIAVPLALTLVSYRISHLIRGWLDLVPLGILRLAATSLNPAQRQALYEEEWLPELTYVLQGGEGRPITRLARGTMFSLGLLTVAGTLQRPQRLRQRAASAFAWRITDFAAMLAGRKRPAVREEWYEHLTGLLTWRKVGAALGFVVAAVRCRLREAADRAWVPADAVLRSRPLSNLVVGMPTVTAAAILFRHDGIDGVIASWESITAICGSLYALIRIGRWWRNVKPPDPKGRTARK